MNEPTSIELRDLCVTYKTAAGAIEAVKDCSFTLPTRTICGLVGESGSGKTSILMAIPRLLPPGTTVSGQILCGPAELSAMDEKELDQWRWRRIAIVPQGASASFTPHITIGGHIIEVLQWHLHMTKQQAHERAGELLATVGLEEHFLRRFPHELSGGQKQRAALATALACKPDFLLADEPTTALDVITQKEVLDMTVALVRQLGMGLLLVTHDLPLAASICDRLMVMKDGVILESGNSRELIAEPRTDYTRQLIASLRAVEQANGLRTSQ